MSATTCAAVSGFADTTNTTRRLLLLLQQDRQFARDSVHILLLPLVPATRGDQMSRATASHTGRSGNPKIAGLSLVPAALKHGRVKPMNLKLIHVAS